MIISFSGLDGAGKTTQINMLLDAYQTKGAKVGSIYSYIPDIRYHSAEDLRELYKKLLSYDVIHVRYRLNSDRNCEIMRKLESKMPPQRIKAVTAAIQGYQDHNELSKYVLDPLINKNKILIFDRYYYDELAFKYVYGCPEFVLKSIYQNEKEADLAFLIKISSKECIKRNQYRADRSVAIYQSRTCIDSLVDRFDYIAERKKLITLDGLLSKKTIAKLVFDHIIMDP